MGKSCCKSRRKDPIGEQPRPRAAPGSAAAPGRERPLHLEPPRRLPLLTLPLPLLSGGSVPWEGVEESTESLKAG